MPRHVVIAAKLGAVVPRLRPQVTSQQYERSSGETAVRSAGRRLLNASGSATGPATLRGRDAASPAAVGNRAEPERQVRLRRAGRSASPRSVSPGISTCEGIRTDSGQREIVAVERFADRDLPLCNDVTTMAQRLLLVGGHDSKRARSGNRQSRCGRSTSRTRVQRPALL